MNFDYDWIHLLKKNPKIKPRFELRLNFIQKV